MAKLTDEDILSIVNAELTNAPAQQNLQDPLDYYLGLPNGTEVEGQSQLTSTDVADSIEWILPQIMESFTQTNEVVIFDPVNPGDEKQAELESEYVYNVVMKKNNGFIHIHTIVKDALMQRNGILKVYYEEYSEVKKESYTGLNDAQLQMLASQQDVEIIELTTNQEYDPYSNITVNFHDVKIAITKKSGKICIESVPLEEFRVTANHNSIDLKDARFTAHTTTKTKSDLRKEGFKKEVIDNLPKADLNLSSYRFQAQGENAIGSNNLNSIDENDSMEEYQISECYMYLDIDDDGIAEYCKVTVAGDTLTPSTVLEVEELDYCPWVATTAILMSHKFQGLSIYDRIKQIQDHKTALIRNIQDNIYLQNNQRTKVLEGQVNIDDVMSSLPGGLIRMKRLDAMEPVITPQLGPAAFDMIRYLDETRAGRTGVAAEGTATPQNMGDRVGSMGVERLMNAKEALVGLMIRVIAETAIKPLCLKVRDLARKHIDTMEDFKFRGEWVQVHPSSWNDRSECTIRVGTGTGDNSAKLMALDKVLQAQAAIVNQPGQALVQPEKIFNALDEFCKLSGLNGANKFFTDPTSQAGQQITQQASQQAAQQAQQAQQQQLAELQVQQQIAQSAVKTAEAQQLNVELRHQAETAKHQLNTVKEQYKIQLDQYKVQLDQLQQQLDEAQNNGKLAVDVMAKKEELEFKYQELETKSAIEVMKIEASRKEEPEESEEDFSEVLAALQAGFDSQLDILSKPKTVVRDSNGRIAGVKYDS